MDGTTTTGTLDTWMPVSRRKAQPVLLKANWTYGVRVLGFFGSAGTRPAI
jgi:hypothetical protein